MKGQDHHPLPLSSINDFNFHVLFGKELLFVLLPILMLLVQKSQSANNGETLFHL